MEIVEYQNEDELFCIWLENSEDAHKAWIAMIDHGLLTLHTGVVFLKEMNGLKRGWGFSDHNTGLMCKMALNL